MFYNSGSIGYILGIRSGATVQSSLDEARPRRILANGTIYPTADAPATSRALAIVGSHIAYVGDLDGARDALPGARETDLRGRTVLPAFIDSHTHFHRASLVAELYLDFETLAPTSIEDVLGHVRERAATLPAGAWIQGDSISAAQLREARLPVRRELDAAAPHHPVLIRGIGKHVVVANSAALAAAGIDEDTPDPPGGRIERDGDGQPTGVLHERAKLRLDASATDTVVPQPRLEERLVALQKGVRRLHRLGVAAIHEMVRQPEEAADWSALHASASLGLRVRLYYRVHESPISLEWLTSTGVRSGWGDDWLRVGGVKISVDGWCIFRNAAVYEPYLDDPDASGIMRIEPERLATLVQAADRAGLRVAVHAVGARAVDAALEAFSAARPWRSGPHRLEHAHLDVDEARLRRVAELGLSLSAQPAFLAAYLADWRLGLPARRIERIMPLALASRCGIPLLINSDVPSGPLGPLGAIHAAVARGRADEPVGADQALTLEQAWRAHTTNPAVVTQEVRAGRIERGCLADLVIFGHDPIAGREVPAAVDATMIGGDVVHDPHGWLG